MGETFTYVQEHSPMLGWGMLVICVLSEFWLRKERMFVGPALGSAGAIVYLTFQLVGPIGGLLPPLLMLGFFIDSFRSKKSRGKPMVKQVGYGVLAALVLALWVWVGVGDQPKKMILGKDNLTIDYGRDVFLHEWASVSLDKSDLSASAVHYEDTEYSDWLFKSNSDPGETIEIGPGGLYRDEAGRLWSSREFGRYVVQWAGVTPVETTEEYPPFAIIRIADD